MDARRNVTAEELERMGERDYDHELVRGVLVPMKPGGREHGAVAMTIGIRLGVFVEEHRLGRVYAAETGYILRRDPDTVRAPDVSFVTRERESAMTSWRGFIQGPPDLAIEVRSPDDTMAELSRKAADYLDAGTRVVWIFDPIGRKVHVYRTGEPRQVLGPDGTLDGGNLLPGFTLTLRELFELPGR